MMRKYVAVFLISMVCLIQGCVLGVGWLPDSSGFVFTSPTGDLIAYDIVSKEQRVVLHDRAAYTTCWPAVSPSGNRIALGQLQDSKQINLAVLRIKVCDLQGNLEIRTDEIKFATFTGKQLRYSTQVVWSPDEKKILLHGQGTANQGTGFDVSALFDIASGELETWDGYAPAYINGSPTRPDGKGFLLVNMQSNSFLWVDWDGSEKQVAFGGQTQTKVEAGQISHWTALYDSRWDGVMAVLTTPTHRFVIDTEKLQMIVDEIRESDSKINNDLIHKRIKLESGVELLLLVQDERHASGPSARLVARETEESAPTEVVAPIRDQMILLSLAPDGKHAILRVSYGYRGSKGDVIYVINNSGRLYDTITVKERGGPSARFDGK